MFESEEPHDWDQPSRPRRWTFGRVSNDLIMALMAVLVTIYAVRGIANCGGDLLTLASLSSLLLLAARPGWRALKAVNDRLDKYLPNHLPDPKPEPLDDF
jgi:hypothetical protein